MTLTRMESLIHEMRQKGMTQTQISLSLGLADSTVKTHIKNLGRKLSSSSYQVEDGIKQARKKPAGIHRDAIINSAIQAAYEKLPPADQKEIDVMVECLTSQIKNMGRVSALELLAKLGIFSAGKIMVMVNIQDRIQNPD